MLNGSDRAQLAKLASYVNGFYRPGATPQVFWDGFYILAGELGGRVLAGEASEELRERYLDIRANADDAGYAVPNERMSMPFPKA